MECCKSIQATPEPDSAQVRFDRSAAPLPPVAWLETIVMRAADALPAHAICDHGPPRAESFAVSVLGRSLLSNAPPVAA